MNETRLYTGLSYHNTQKMAKKPHQNYSCHTACQIWVSPGRLELVRYIREHLSKGVCYAEFAVFHIQLI